MRCSNEKCHDDANVQLTQTVQRSTWMCGYCAAKFLSVTNPHSFKTIKEKSLINYTKDKTDVVVV